MTIYHHGSDVRGVEMVCANQLPLEIATYVPRLENKSRGGGVGIIERHGRWPGLETCCIYFCQYLTCSFISSSLLSTAKAYSVTSEGMAGGVFEITICCLPLGSPL
jgi:hypothetical protein